MGEWKDGRMGRPCFLGHFWLSPEINAEKDVDLTKNYFITVSKQKICSIHKLILRT